MIRSRIAALAAVLAAGAAALPLAASAATHVTLDAWGAWVRQDLPPGTISDGGRAVRIELPSGFRPESVQLWNETRPVAVRGWNVDGRLLTLSPAAPLSPRVANSVAYRLDTLRGIPVPAPGNLDGIVVVNESDCDFAADAWTWLDTGDPIPPADRLPGRPDVNPDAPLSTLWLPPPPPRRPGKAEPLPALDGASVAARSSHRFVWGGNTTPDAPPSAPSSQPPALEATRPEAGPVLASILHELDESCHRAARWLDAAIQNLPAEPAPLPELPGPPESASPENLFPALLADTSPAFFANACRLADALDELDGEWIFPDGAEPVEWRKALVRAIVVRQRIDPATTGGYWAASRDASPAERLRDTLLALAALETASGLSAPIPRDRLPDAFIPIP